MAFKFLPHECNAQGVPFVKLANVVLEKDGVQKTFVTQEEVDTAWADGWHDTGRPETADVKSQETADKPTVKKRTRRKKKDK